MTQNLALVQVNEKQEICSKHGAFTATETSRNKYGYIYWSVCQSCQVERDAANEAARLEHEAYERKSTFQKRIDAASIPSRFLDVGFDDYRAESDSQRRALDTAIAYAENFDDNLAAGRCMVLSGRVGTGKTHLSCAILRAIVSKPFTDPAKNWRKDWHRVRYATISEIIRTIRATWNNREAPEEDAIRKFTRPALLVMDEVGRQFGSDAERTQIEEILDLRYQDMLPTVVCTNVGDKTQIAQFLGERGFDRLRENGGILSVFDWASHRGAAG